MASAKDEFIPDLSLVGEVIDQSIAPTLRRFESELGRKLPVVLHVYSREEQGPTVLIAESEESATDEPVGEARVRFRRTYKPTRYLFYAQVLFNDRNLAPGTGLSGFSIKGDVNLKDDEVVVGQKGWTGLYNFWNWRNWV